MSQLIDLVPPVKRIRGNRLYLHNGQRLLDLWMDGGRTLLGEEARKARLYAANAADKGLAYAISGMYEQRLRKALYKTWPDFQTAAIYLNEERALAAYSRHTGRTVQVLDSAAVGTSVGIAASEASSPGAELFLLRPFCQVPRTSLYALARLPCPQPFAPVCLLIRDFSDAQQFAGDLIPPLMHSAATRALDSLARCDNNGYNEKWWLKIGNSLAPFFLRNGPYLFPIAPECRTPAAYESLFRAALDSAVLLSPYPDQPSIIPTQLDDNELRRMVAALERWQLHQ